MTETVEKEVENAAVVADKDIMEGAARIDGTRVRVSDIVVAHEYRGWAPRKIAEQFPTASISDVYTALDYYEHHKQEIRQEIQEREQTFKEAAEHRG